MEGGIESASGGEHAPYVVLRTETCEEQLRETAFYLMEKTGKDAAFEFLDRVEHACNELASFPRLGRVPRWRALANRRYRMLVVGDYLMFYKVNDALHQVLVYAVVNGRRRYEGMV